MLDETKMQENAHSQANLQQMTCKIHYFREKRPLRTNIYVRIISVLLLVTQETELCL